MDDDNDDSDDGDKNVRTNRKGSDLAEISDSSPVLKCTDHSVTLEQAWVGFDSSMKLLRRAASVRTDIVPLNRCFVSM